MPLRQVHAALWLPCPSRKVFKWVYIVTSLLSEVHWLIVPDSRSSCTEHFFAKVGLCPTDEKHTSRSQAQSCWAGVGDEAASVSQLAGSMSRQCLVDQGGDFLTCFVQHVFIFCSAFVQAHRCSSEPQTMCQVGIFSLWRLFFYFS